MTKTIPELDAWIAARIQGGFGQADMAIMKEEIEKLESGDLYLEIGVDEGRSLTVAHHYAKEGVWTVGVDYIDSPNRGPYMNIPLGWNPQGVSLITHGSHCMFIHGDSEMVAQLFDRPISLLFIDGDHSYEGVQKDHNAWVHKVKKGGTVLYHDYDHPDTKRFLDDTYGDNKEVCHGKIVRIKI